MAETPEGKVKKDIKKVLNKHSIFWFMPVNNGMGKGGVSDFICCRPVVITAAMVGKTFGLFMAVEAKADGKDATDRQADFLDDVYAHGGRGYVVAGCKNAAELDKLLDEVRD